MAKTAEKFFIVAERHNPQLGTYLSDVIIGTKRVNKNSISCRYDYYGETRSMKFTLHSSGDLHGHYCIDSGSCVYGSMSYYGFERAADAQIYLDRNWSDHYNYKRLSEKLGVPHKELVVA